MYSFSLGVGFLPKGIQLWPVSLGVCFGYQGSIYDFLFFFWGGGGGEGGEVYREKMFEPRGGDKNFFRPSRGPGACSPGKFGKYSIQDWLKLHFWTLVTFTDSLKSSWKKIFIWNSFNLFSGKLFLGGELPRPQWIEPWLFPFPGKTRNLKIQRTLKFAKYSTRWKVLQPFGNAIFPASFLCFIPT